MKNKTKNIIGYSLLGVGLLILLLAPALLLWKESLAEMGFSYWKVQLGWISIVLISMFCLKDEN